MKQTFSFALAGSLVFILAFFFGYARGYDGARDANLNCRNQKEKYENVYNDAFRNAQVFEREQWQKRIHDWELDFWQELERRCQKK